MRKEQQFIRRGDRELEISASQWTALMAVHQLAQELVIDPYEDLDVDDGEDYRTIIVEKTALRDQPVQLIHSRWETEKDEGHTKIALVHLIFPRHNLLMFVTVHRELGESWKPVSIYWHEKYSDQEGTYCFNEVEV